MSGLKYKVGDKVRIQSKEWYESHKNKFGKVWTVCLSGEGTICFDHDNAKYCGKVLTIAAIEPENYAMVGNSYAWTDEMIEGLVEEETKFGTASKPIEIKSNANCLTRERVDALATKIDKKLPSGNQNVWELPNGYQFTDENGNVINATKIVLEKKKKEYPKDYDECCYVLFLSEDGRLYTKGYKASLIQDFQKLLICRDAYWKIAGEEMGLGKPWEPDWEENSEKSIITKFRNAVAKFNTKEQYTFAFPTEEMRDAFYENFKKEIEICKELL